MKILFIPHDKQSYDCAKIVEKNLYNIEVLDYDCSTNKIEECLKQKDYDFSIGLYEEIDTSQNELQIACSGRNDIPEIVIKLIDIFKDNTEIMVANKDIISRKNTYYRTDIDRRTDKTYTFSWFFEIRKGEEHGKNNFVIAFNKSNHGKIDKIANCIQEALNDMEKESTNHIKEEVEENQSSPLNRYNNTYNRTKKEITRK